MTSAVTAMPRALAQRITSTEPPVDTWQMCRREFVCSASITCSPLGPSAPDTFCDALQTPRVSPITFDILRKRGAEALSVSDTEVADAMRFAWEKHGLVVEPGGAVALAALLTGKAEPREATVVVVSGGNIDPALHARIVANA